MENEEVKKILEEYKNDTKRHFDVVAEDLKNQIKIVSEQVAANTEKLTEHDLRFNKIEEKLEGHDLRFNKIEDTLGVIKLDIEFIKNELKQKVSRDEFIALEKRVSMLETKIK